MDASIEKNQGKYLEKPKNKWGGAILVDKVEQTMGPF